MSLVKPIAFSFAVLLALAPPALTEDEPYLRFAEENGHLVVASALKSGKTDFDMVDGRGQQLKGFVFVDREQNDRRVRLFRLISSGRAARLDEEGNLEASDTAGEFSVVYQ